MTRSAAGSQLKSREVHFNSSELKHLGDDCMNFIVFISILMSETFYSSTPTEYLSTHFLYTLSHLPPQVTILQQFIPSSSSPLCGEWPSNARLINHAWRCPSLLHPAILLSLTALL